ncbi:hypothetical protein [Rhodohalobacter sp.]|uniref:hypothetical protein n=1 Tax=Rhodohalobacter sp. TaxID=1974210 RepID=UPI00356331EF
MSSKGLSFGPKSRHLSINATDHEFNRIISVRHFEPFCLFNGVYALTLLQYETCHDTTRQSSIH